MSNSFLSIHAEPSGVEHFTLSTDSLLLYIQHLKFATGLRALNTTGTTVVDDLHMYFVVLLLNPDILLCPLLCLYYPHIIDF